MNKANCSTCDHKKNPDGGWCYMFRQEPEFTCQIHTNKKVRITHVLDLAGVDEMFEQFFPEIRRAELTK